MQMDERTFYMPLKDDTATTTATPTTLTTARMCVFQIGEQTQSVKSHDDSKQQRAQGLHHSNE